MSTQPPPPRLSLSKPLREASGTAHHPSPSNLRLGRLLAVAQEVEELDAFAQPALHHVPVANHLAHDRADLARAEVEAPVHLLDLVEDHLAREVRVRKLRDLRAAVGQQVN